MNYGTTGRQPIDSMEFRVAPASIRLAIVNATIRCLLDYGLAQTSSQRIAKVAGVSAESILHYFPQAQPILPVVRILFAKRLRSVAASMACRPVDTNPLDFAVSSYWHHINQPHFVLFLELGVASRVDCQIAQAFMKAQAAFDARLDAIFARLYPAEKPPTEVEITAFHCNRYAMEGMAADLLLRSNRCTVAN